jgi:hypothetical protein
MFNTVYKSSIDIKLPKPKSRDSIDFQRHDYEGKLRSVLKKFCKDRNLTKTGTTKQEIIQSLVNDNDYIQKTISMKNEGKSRDWGDSFDWTCEDYLKYKKFELKTLLEKRMIQVSGSKSTMIFRLLNNNKFILNFIKEEENRRVRQFIRREAKKLKKEQDKKNEKIINCSPQQKPVDQDTQTHNFGTWTYNGAKYLIDTDNNLYDYYTHSPVGKYETPVFL